MSTRFWTCHWQNRFWRRDVNAEYEPVDHSAGNNFSKRGITPGDVAYIVSIADGQLLLGGRMTVSQILSYQEAVTHFGNENFYEANEHLIGVKGSGTPLNLHRRLSPALTKELRFASKNGPKEPCFVSDTDLDNQATRGVRELTQESALLLDQIIEATDQLPKSGQILTITHELLGGVPVNQPDEFRLPEEVPIDIEYREGTISRISVNRYERDPKARAACIALHGTSCCICGFSFGSVYGAEAENYIHVHHLNPLSEGVGTHVIDPVKDLRPVCPNCHAVVHLNGRCRSIEEVQQLLTQQKQV